MTSQYEFDDFGDMYAEVKKILNYYVAEAVRRGEMTPSEQVWFDSIIAGFTREFQAWPNIAQPEIAKYIGLFVRGRASFQLRIAAHAFLHIAYDLPRVIADSLIRVPTADRPRLRTLFLRPAPLFRDVFLARARRGQLGILARPVGYFKPAEILCYWVIALRSVAWIHAEVLVDSPGSSRAALESGLASALLCAGIEAKKHKWVFGIPKFDNSRIFQLSPASLLVDQPWILPTLAAIALVGLASRMRYQSIANQLDIFGDLVLVETTRFLANGSRESARQ
jgi:hypothetical protein